MPKFNCEQHEVYQYTVSEQKGRVSPTVTVRTGNKANQKNSTCANVQMNRYPSIETTVVRDYSSLCMRNSWSEEHAIWGEREHVASPLKNVILADDDRKDASQRRTVDLPQTGKPI